MPAAVTRKSSSNGKGQTDLAETRKMPKGTEERVRVVVPEIVVSTLRARLVGHTALICDNGASSIPKLRKRQSADAKVKKGPRDPKADFEASRYLNAKGEDCFPSLGITKSLQVAAWKFTGDSAKGLFQVVGGEFLPMKCSKPINYEKNVRNQGIGRPADLRYRAMYEKWSIDIEIEYLSNFITLDQVVNLLRLAGRAVGLGNWRPEKGGPYGTFDVEANG